MQLFIVVAEMKRFFLLLQIKCELRLLAQFSFNLSVDYEIADIVRKKRNLTLNETLKKKVFLQRNIIGLVNDHPKRPQKS